MKLATRVERLEATHAATATRRPIVMVEVDGTNPADDARRIADAQAEAGENGLVVVVELSCTCV